MPEKKDLNVLIGTNIRQALTARLALLTEEEFRLCSEIICKLLEALQHGKS